MKIRHYLNISSHACRHEGGDMKHHARLHFQALLWWDTEDNSTSSDSVALH